MMLVYERRSGFGDLSKQQHTLYIELWSSTNSSVQWDMEDNCRIVVTTVFQILELNLDRIWTTSEIDFSHDNNSIS